jgi:primosomal protein N' (replication factor Y)
MPRQPSPNACTQRPTGKHKLQSLPPSARSYTYNGANQRTQVGKALGARDELRGPSPCPIEKIKDEYRWQIWYFVAGVTQVIGELSKLRAEFAWPDDAVQVVDVDPVSLM